MRLNIMFILGLFLVTTAGGQISIEKQNFNRKNLEWDLVLSNKGKKTVFLEALGATSSFLALEVCQEEEPSPIEFSELSVSFPVNRSLTIQNLSESVPLPAGQETPLTVSLFPLPQAICDYWETDVQLLLGTSDFQQVMTQSVTVTEDDYFNKKDWLDQFKEEEGKEFVFVPKHLSRLQLMEALQSGEKLLMIGALRSFNEFFWPAREVSLYLQPLISSGDSTLQSMARQVMEGQQKKLSKARNILLNPQEYEPGQKQVAVEGLGLARDVHAIEPILQFWEKDKSMEPHLVARSLINIGVGKKLSDLRELALELEKAADAKSGFSHDRWKWLTVATLLAHYGDEQAPSILERSFDFMLNNFEYRELQLMLEALNRSDNHSLKKSLHPFYKKTIEIRYSEELTLAAFPLYLGFSEEEESEKMAWVKNLLNSADEALRKTAIRQAGLQHFTPLLPLLEEQYQQSKDWQERSLLKKTMAQLN